MAIWMIKGESADFCCINDYFVYEHHSDDGQDVTDAALEQCGHDMDAHLAEYYDEYGMEEVNDEPAFSYDEAVLWTYEEFGDYKSAAYVNLNA